MCYLSTHSNTDVCRVEAKLNKQFFYVFSTVHHSIELFHLPTLMRNSLFINKCMLHYYPRHVSSINMPIFRRKNCIHTASGIVALCKSLHSTPVYCAAVYRERRYQMLCTQFFLLKMCILMLETCRG